MIQLLPSFKEFLNLLNSKRVRYLIIGGFAVAHYGHARATGDIDVWVAVDSENIDCLRAALIQFGFNSSSLAPRVFVPPKTVLRIGFPPERIEVLIQIAGVEFDECIARSERVVLDGVPVSVISKPDLLLNKRAAGRPKDLADIDALTHSKPARRRKSTNRRPPGRSSKS